MWGKGNTYSSQEGVPTVQPLWTSVWRSCKECKNKSTIHHLGAYTQGRYIFPPRYLLIHIHAALYLSLFPYSCHKSLKFQQQNVGYASLLLEFGLDHLTCSAQWEIRCHTRGLEMHQLCFGPFSDDTAITMRTASLVFLHDPENEHRRLELRSG